MNIVLVRIDDRLIHGQVATSWAKQDTLNRIIVVNDVVAADSLRTTLLKQAAPQEAPASVVGVEKFKRVYHNPKYANDNVFLLFTNPGDILRIIQSGVPIRAVNVGGMSYKEGKVKVTKAIFADEQDAADLRMLAGEYQVELDNRLVVGSGSDNVLDLLDKSGI